MEEEIPIFEILKENECYIISKTKDNILVLSNHVGLVGLTRIPIPIEVKEVSRLALVIGDLAYNCAICRMFRLNPGLAEIKMLSHVQRHVRQRENLTQQESVEEGLRALFREVK
ncbi:hypothetical protein LCGC14_2593670 [marine sediment metagenome]|uniref:Uncharacterized protein n=1 Tax=marine sediment metagenome TaxID=412755 RepID=A0A0F9AB40_9ZZZZ